ncbi:MAG: hypothetical protein KAT77_03145 [Nanoarchaeota archaeon]|nr:hypothetical protein [Nanoarchaeota archaeon]
MNLSQLKREVEKLDNFEKKISLFNKHWIRSNKYEFLKDEDKEQLKALRKVIKELKYGQVVNEKIKSLVNHLVRFQIHALNNDQEEKDKITHHFIKDKNSNIRKVIDEVNYIEFQLQLFKDFYEKIIYRLGKKLDLEGNMDLVDGQHYQYLKDMIQINQKQKNYLKEIGNKFVQLNKND